MIGVARGVEERRLRSSAAGGERERETECARDHLNLRELAGAVAERLDGHPGAIEHRQ